MIRIILLLLVSSAGFVLAGYIGLFELMIELAVCAWTLLRVWEAEPEKRSMLSFGWILAIRRQMASHALKRRTIRASIPVAMVGVISGWMITLGWLFIRDIGFVLAREIKETILDIIVFVPLVLVMASQLAKVEPFEEPDEVVTDPRDPESYNFMMQYARAQAAASAPIMKLLTSLNAWIPFLILALWTGTMYLAGWAIHSKAPIVVLEAMRNWSL